ncbi:MAG TPA: restriction endonuclease subunit S [Chitinophagales bacterium]|nr:restriction endonuclease subunit S [Chitinophagales bacterium]
MKNKIWETDKLEKCVDYLSRGKSPSYVESSEVFALNQKAIRWGYIDRNELKHHNPDVKIAENHFIRKGDVVINSTGDITIGRAFYFNDIDYKLFADSHVAIVRTNEKKLNSKFFSYLLKLDAYQTKIYNLVTGATGQLELSKSQLAKLEVDLPPLHTQKRIASILSAYDDLIEVNNQRIKLLEQSARELYKEWFVRMRFPGYKQAKFKKGVPDGWVTKTLDEFGKIYTGKTPSTKVPEYYGGDIPFIKTPDLHRSLFVFETEERLTEKGNNTQKRSTLPANSICVSCIGTGGIVAITTAEKSQTNQQINSLIPSNKNQMEFLYYRILDLKETIELFGGTGATMTNLSKGKFEKLKILFPIKELVESYHKIVYPMFDQIKILQQQNTQLRQIRDRLLPRLISGKLQVSEAEFSVWKNEQD